MHNNFFVFEGKRWLERWSENDGTAKATLCTRTTSTITKSYIKNIRTTINKNIKSSKIIRITTRNRDRALKVPRDCLTIQKNISYCDFDKKDEYRNWQQGKRYGNDYAQR